MAALANEPFRANCVVRVTNGTGTRHFRLGFRGLAEDTGQDGDDSDSWEEAPGSELKDTVGNYSCILDWDTTSPALAPPQATVVRISARVPGSATNIGATQSVVISGDSGAEFVPFHFDSDPFNAIAGAARTGMVEWYMEVERASGVDQWGPADSRGGFANSGVGRSHDWARGYVRAQVTLSDFQLSNEPLPAAEPPLWAFDDEIHWQATLDATPFETSEDLQLRILDGGTLKQSSTDFSASGAVYSASATPDGSRIDNSYLLAQALYEVGLRWSNQSQFGGDFEMFWAGGPAGWAVAGAGIDIIDDDRMNIDPRINVDHHLQVNDNQFASPPGSLDIPSKQRLTADLGFVGFRLTNVRNEGINGLTVQETLRDADNLVAAVFDRSIITQAQGGEDGWVATWATWDSALPGGGWIHTVDITTSHGQGLEVTPTATYVLLAKDPNIIPVAAGGHDQPGEDGLHWTPNNDLLVGCTLFNVSLDATISVDDSDVLDPGGAPYPRAYMIVARFNNATGQAEYFDSDMTWKSVEDNPGTVYQWQLMSIRRSNILTGVGAVGDELTYVHKFSPAETANWGLSELIFLSILYKNATPYSMWGITAVTGGENRHTGYSVDPVALGLHGVLGTR